MVWATSVLPRNEHLPGIGDGRDAMADNAHGVNVHKNREPSVFDKKRGGEGRDTTSPSRRAVGINRSKK